MWACECTGCGDRSSSISRAVYFALTHVDVYVYESMVRYDVIVVEGREEFGK
jgi:hypothetical protein